MTTELSKTSVSDIVCCIVRQFLGRWRVLLIEYINQYFITDHVHTYTKAYSSIHTRIIRYYIFYSIQFSCKTINLTPHIAKACLYTRRQPTPPSLKLPTSTQVVAVPATLLASPLPLLSLLLPPPSPILHHHPPTYVPVVVASAISILHPSTLCSVSTRNSNVSSGSVCRYIMLGGAVQETWLMKGVRVSREGRGV